MNTAAVGAKIERIAMLDGWRAFSILSVIAGHWLPLGPKAWQLNSAVAASGMAIFFTLSGFLITQLMLRDDRVGPFLIRRLFRVVPLAWTAMIALAVLVPENRANLLTNLAFYANLPPASLMEGGKHLWSLCVEVQFYALVAVIVALTGRRGLYILPVLAAFITTLRFSAGEAISIVTWHRLDEILAGATLALVVTRNGLENRFPQCFVWAPLCLGTLLLASAHPALPLLNYARPYLAAATIGISLYTAPCLMRLIWTARPARYIAEISYALYVVHEPLRATWLGGQDASLLERYLRRPLLIAATFALAHFSTFHYESRWTALGKRVVSWLSRNPVTQAHVITPSSSTPPDYLPHRSRS